jgi:hypothetical protein
MLSRLLLPESPLIIEVNNLGSELAAWMKTKKQTEKRINPQLWKYTCCERGSSAKTVRKTFKATIS